MIVLLVLEIYFRKFLSVYQQVTSIKYRFFESIIYFPDSYFCLRKKCCNFTLGIWVIGVR